MYTINEETKEITITEFWSVSDVTAVIAMMSDDDLPDDVILTNDDKWEILKRVIKSNEFLWTQTITDAMIEAAIIEYVEEKENKMEFTVEELFEIARSEYMNADFVPEVGSPAYITWKEGVLAWAVASSDEQYESEEEVREELRRYIKEEKEYAK